MHRLEVCILAAPNPYLGRCLPAAILRSMLFMTTSWKQLVLLLLLALCAYLVPISTNGAWVVLAPLAAACSYLAGRHVSSLAHGLLALGAGTLAAGVTLALSSHLSLLTFALNILTGLVLFALLPWWAGRARRNAVLFRSQERRHVVVQAELRERARIAEAMHDQLGHDLALLALSSSGLQVSLEKGTPAYAQAARIREQADESIEHLHQIIGVLHEDGDQAPLGPAGSSLEQLVEQARAKGMKINFTRHGPSPQAPGSIRWAAVLRQVAQEALTNAAKYAPHAEVELELDTRSEQAVLRISNPLHGPVPPVRPGATGIASLRGALEAAGGSLAVHRTKERFELRACIAQSSSPPAPAGVHSPVKRASTSMLVLLPILAVTVIAAALLLLQHATYQATALHPSEYQKLKVGMDSGEVASLVRAPGLDEPLPVIDEPAPPENAQCRYYAARTGLLDLGSEMFRLCFTDDVLVSTDHLYPAG